MAEYILETKGLGISFGGLKAAQEVNIKRMASSKGSNLFTFIDSFLLDTIF